MIASRLLPRKECSSVGREAIESSVWLETPVPSPMAKIRMEPSRRTSAAFSMAVLSPPYVVDCSPSDRIQITFCKPLHAGEARGGARGGRGHRREEA